ncbi:MAG: C4-dicarboxylate ABC transporter, partial [Gammaproteobacteria bacterium]|nr:C4-dicarboxylate ABC transporter [Gammaproteobacteria bacterium]
MKLLKALTGVAGAIALTTGSAFAEDLRWKMPVAFATNLPGLG